MSGSTQRIRAGDSTPSLSCTAMANASDRSRSHSGEKAREQTSPVTLVSGTVAVRSPVSASQVRRLSSWHAPTSSPPSGVKAMTHVAKISKRCMRTALPCGMPSSVSFQILTRLSSLEIAMLRPRGEKAIAYGFHSSFQSSSIVAFTVLVFTSQRRSLYLPFSRAQTSIVSQLGQRAARWTVPASGVMRKEDHIESVMFHRIACPM
mmetsp:Transcript_47715/g.113563  ORF Transcript_47715/g.113563 Transcript_47715/m.113563 type:complete len:206 (-) Transcript_47715:631-1248(-)